MEKNSFNQKFNEYLEDCKLEKKNKHVIIATDKQCVMYSSTDVQLDESHNDLTAYAENMIHPNDNTNGWSSYKLHDAYLLIEGPEIIANLPLDGNLSLNQAGFLIDILGDICKFHIDNDNQASIDIMTSTGYETFSVYSFKRISNYILSSITGEYEPQEENIIGKTNIDNKLVNRMKTKVYEKR